MFRVSSSRLGTSIMYSVIASAGMRTDLPTLIYRISRFSTRLRQLDTDVSVSSATDCREYSLPIRGDPQAGQYLTGFFVVAAILRSVRSNGFALMAI